MGLYCDIIMIPDDKIDKCIKLADDQNGLYRFIQDTDPENWFELDKAWHGINYILSSISAEYEAGFLLNQGTVLRKYNWGEVYGVNVTDMRLFDSAQTNKINNCLSKISAEIFRKNYNSGKLAVNKIYPGIWKQVRGIRRLINSLSPSELAAKEFLTGNYLRLAEFISKTAGLRTGIIIKYHQ